MSPSMSTQAAPSETVPARASLAPPGPPRALGPLIFYRLIRHPLEMFHQAATRYGDVVFLPALWRRIFFINHPDYIRDMLVTSAHKFEKSPAIKSMKPVLGEGLLTSEGEFHLRQRRLAQPAFHRQRIAGYGAVMSEYAVRERERWREGEEFDIHTAMMKLTLSIAGKTLFDTNVDDNAAEIGQAMHLFMETFALMYLPFGEHFEKLPLPKMRRVRKSRERLDEIVYALIADRRRSGRDHGDLLSMLMAAKDTEGDGSTMSDQQLRDESLTILMAGHETTANALSWTWMLLAQNPDVERKMSEEIIAVLTGKPPTTEDYPKLKYTEMVFAESMRLYPPAWGMGRMALQDVEFGGFSIPKLSMIICSPWVMHRDARYWPEQLMFRPGRFTPEEK